MELTKKQLEYVLECLNFHYAENDDIKADVIEINASICRLVSHQLQEFNENDKSRKRIGLIRNQIIPHIHDR